MNAVVSALGFETRLRPRTARLASFEMTTWRNDHVACSAADEAMDLNGERAQVSVARPRDLAAGGRKEPA